MDLNDLKSKFMASYPESGAPFVCRVPGRVNLMGEHLDYNGLPVLPMAIDRALYIAFTPTVGGLARLQNVNGLYKEATFQITEDLVPSEAGAWENYAKAAIVGINQHFSVTTFSGLDILVASDLPHSAGLSSSSALVVGIGMAYLSAIGLTLGQDITRLDFSGLLANAEHFVGTAGGGMDQTAILLGEAHHATRINFLPFQVEQVPLPGDVTFLLCDSLVAANKSGETLTQYNAGPASCNLIVTLINTHLQKEFGEDFAIDCLGDLWFGPLCFNRTEVQALLDEVFPDPFATPASIATALQIAEGELNAQWLDYIAFGAEGLPLQARARHVLSEYYRVEEGRDALLARDMATFGRLMNDSHRSCAVDYGISTADLDELCAILTDEGCFGARLTGAGFGGAVVAVATQYHVDGILAAVNGRYYSKRPVPDSYCPAFAISAGDGARYY